MPIIIFQNKIFREALFRCNPVKLFGLEELLSNIGNQFPVTSTSHSYALTAVSANVTSADVQFDAAQSAAYRAYQQQNNQVIQSVGQNRPRNTFCNRIGNQVFCNTY